MSRTTINALIAALAIILLGLVVYAVTRPMVPDTNITPTPTSTSTQTPTPTSTPATGKENLIRVRTPQPNAVVRSPLRIEGEARGNWYFEASFPIRLLDSNGNVLGTAIAQAQGEWMTTNFVPFSVAMNFTAPTTTDRGTLVLEKDNPSGLPQNDDELRIPVRFERQMRTVKLYYYSATQDADGSGNPRCSRDGLIAVDREIPVTTTPIQDAIKELLEGDLTVAERARGISTEYPLAGLVLRGASLNKGGVLTLEFSDPQNRTGGGSCRANLLWYQIEATAKQFSEVREVRFIPTTLFQP